jgi:periplasmic protein TonB
MRFWQSFGSALTLEALLIGALLAWIGLSQTKPVEPVIPLTIEALTPPELVKPPEPVMALPPVKPTPPSQIPMAKSLPRVAPKPPPQPPILSKVPVPAAPETATPQPPAPVAPMAASTPVVAASAAVAPGPVSPPRPVAVPPAAPVADPSPAYNARLTAAAQAAFEVPGSVASLNFKGRTRVGFKLLDGEVSGVIVAQPSGLGAMDRAAVKAVQTARFPPPPVAFQGKEMSYEIWVTHAPAS